MYLVISLFGFEGRIWDLIVSVPDHCLSLLLVYYNSTEIDKRCYLIFKDRSVTSSIPTYFRNSEPPIICYKYNKPIRNTVFNFNKHVSDLDIHANTRET